MSELIVIPIEPLVERYTKSWYHNIPEAFKDAGFDVKVVDGLPLLNNEIKVGTFLDINSTVHYKMSQLQAIARHFEKGKVNPGTVFFFSDVEFWGLEAVRLMAQMNRVPVKLCGFLHAASYTQEDAFEIAAPYQKYTEVGWLSALDKIFVGSGYHKGAVMSRRLWPIVGASTHECAVLEDKIIVTGNPLFASDYAPSVTPKKKKVLLTNRFDNEKRPQETLALFEMLKSVYPHWEFVVTTSRPHLRSNKADLLNQAFDLSHRGVIEIKAGLTKAQYHQELAEASIMVSHSIEENYGYCIAEAMLYGVVPLLRAGLSHDEFVPGRSDLLFTTQTDALEKAAALLDRFDQGLPVAIPMVNTNGMENIVRHVIDLSKE